MDETSRTLALDAGILRVETVTLAGRASPVTVMRMPDWVMIAAVDAAGRFVLVRQLRFGIAAETLEPVGGVVDAGEDPAAAALRELYEETGFIGQVAEPLGWVHPNPVLQDNRCHLFLARGVVAGPARGSDPEEVVAPVWLERAAVAAALAEGRITHALAVITLMRALAATEPG